MDAKEFIHVSFQMHRFHRAFMHQIDMGEFDMPLNRSHLRALVIMAEHEDSTMGQISKMLGLEKGSFTTLVESLISLGCVEKMASSTDKRKVHLRLTEKGRQVSRQVAAHFEQKVDAMLQLLTEQERGEFLAALETIQTIGQAMEQRQK